MKLRARFGRRTAVVILDETESPASLAQLTQAVREEFQISDVGLSLNGMDILCGDEKSLCDLGIVSGDLVRVISKDADMSAAEPTMTSAVQSSVTSTSQPDEKQPDTKPQPVAGPSHAPECSVQELEQDVVDMETDYRDTEAIKDAEVNKYLTEPLLVQESTVDAVPQRLSMVFENAKVQGGHDALTVVLHVMMMESGYLVQHGNEYSMPSDWRNAAGYKLHYTHPACPGMHFKMLGVPLGGVLILHGLTDSDADETKCQLQLKVNGYVSSPGQVIPAVYINLAKLSRVFKDGLAYSLLIKAQQVKGQDVLDGLLGLCMELKLAILKCLDVKSLLNLSETCQEFFQLKQKPELWRNLYLRDFGRRSNNNNLHQDWLALYKECYQRRKQWRRQLARMTVVVPPFMERPHPLLPYMPVYPPGVIGGDYDLNPDFSSGIPHPLGSRVGPGAPHIRFDPIGPLPDQLFRPGGRGQRRTRGWDLPPRGGLGGFGPRMF